MKFSLKVAYSLCVYLDLEKEIHMVYLQCLGTNRLTSKLVTPILFHIDE